MTPAADRSIPPLLPPEQLPGIVVGRAMAAIAVVYIHAQRAESLENSVAFARFGTPFLTAVALFFMFYRVGEKQPKGFLNWFGSKLKHLYVPFVAWSVAYGLFYSLACYLLNRNGIRQIQYQPAWQLSEIFISGRPAIQLYFIPFLLMAITLSFPLLSLVRRVYRNRAASFAIALALMGLGTLSALMPPLEFAAAGEEFNYVLYWGSDQFLPAVPWGIALAILVNTLPHRLASGSRLVMTGGMVVCVASLVGLWFQAREVGAFNHPDSFLRNAAGIGLLLVVINLPASGFTRITGVIGQCGMGIYVTHPAFILLLGKVTRSAHLQPSWWLDMITTIVAVGLGVLLTQLLRASRWTAWLMPVSETRRVIKPKPVRQAHVPVEEELEPATA